MLSLHCKLKALSDHVDQEMLKGKRGSVWINFADFCDKYIDYR